jgi:RNA polymerase-binding protein DksA
MHTTSPPSPSPQVPRQWVWYYQRLQAFRDHLLESRSVQIADVSGPLEAQSTDTADSATDEFDHDLALGILSREQDALYEVEAAIRRILDGSYGICEETGKPIPVNRLRAVPWTRFTREVEERLEQEDPHAS